MVIGEGISIFVEEQPVGRSTGLEPATLGTTNRCSNQLSYDRHGAPWEAFPEAPASLKVAALRRQAKGPVSGPFHPACNRRAILRDTIASRIIATGEMGCRRVD